jgi:DNA-binding NtrC family response regulator
VDRLPVDLHERFRRLLGTGGPRWIASSRTDPGAWPADLPGVLRIEVPPLRARAEDLRPLVAFFLDRHGAGTRRFDESALQLLSTHDWPGNVRELETLVARASLLSEAIELTASDLPPLGDARVRSLSTDVPDTAEALKRAKAGLRARSVEEIERAFLLRALNRGGWNVTRAAKATGLLRPNFQALMRKHGLRKRGA